MNGKSLVTLLIEVLLRIFLRKQKEKSEDLHIKGVASDEPKR
jgi:hypothetical protein